jgi:hypothetical protein
MANPYNPLSSFSQSTPTVAQPAAITAAVKKAAGAVGSASSRLAGATKRTPGAGILGAGAGVGLGKNLGPGWTPSPQSSGKTVSATVGSLFGGSVPTPSVSQRISSLYTASGTPLQLGSQLASSVGLAASKVRRAAQQLSAPAGGNGPAPVITPYTGGSYGGGSYGSGGAGGATDSPVSTPVGSNVGPTGTPADTSSGTSINPLLVLGAGALVVLYLKKHKGGLKL